MRPPFVLSEAMSQRLPRSPVVLASLLASLAWRGALVGILTAPLYCCFGVLYALLLLPRVLLRKLDRRAFGPTLDAADGGGMGGLLLALEAPLALLSYVLYQTTKFFVLPMMSSFEAARRGVDETWVDKLHENIEDPGRIPRLTVFAAICWAPRWNTHTNVHVLWLMDPPEGEATFEVENVRQRGFSWQVIFYDGRQQTLGSIASSPTGGEWLALTLRTAGALQLTIRPYLFDGCASATLPRVRMNGVEVTRGAPVVFKRERLGFNARLKGAYETPLHWALQWHTYVLLWRGAVNGVSSHLQAVNRHTYVLLCCRSMVSAEAVRSIYLPPSCEQRLFTPGAVNRPCAPSTCPSATRRRSGCTARRSKGTRCASSCPRRCSRNISSFAASTTAPPSRCCPRCRWSGRRTRCRRVARTASGRRGSCAKMAPPRGRRCFRRCGSLSSGHRARRCTEQATGARHRARATPAREREEGGHLVFAHVRVA